MMMDTAQEDETADHETGQTPAGAGNAEQAAALKAQGNAAFVAGNFAEARARFTEALALDPTSAVLHSNRSAAAASAGDFAAALEDADAALRLDPAWPRAYSRRAAALHGLGRFAEAADVLREGLTHDPENAGMKEALAAAEVQRRRQEHPPQEPPVDPVAVAFEGDVVSRLRTHEITTPFCEEKDFVAKIEEIRAAPAGQRRNAVLQRHIQSDRRVLAALEVLLGEMGIRLDRRGPSEDDARRAREREDRAREARLAAEAARKKRAEEERLSTLTPAQREALEHKERGNAAYRERRFDDAIDAYNSAIELDPDSGVYLTNRAAVRFEMGHLDECFADCEKAVEAERREVPCDAKVIARAYLRMGNVRMKQERLDDAIELFNKSLLEDRSADALSRLRLAEKTKEERDRLAYISPEIAAAEKERGNELFRRGEFAEAVAAYSEAIRRSPDDHLLFSNRAACYTKMGEYQLALNDCDECVRLKPDFSKGHSRKALCHFFLKEYQKALSSYDVVMKLDPTSTEAEEGVQRTIRAIQERDRGQAKTGKVSDDTLRAIERDPELQQILADPVMQQILQDISKDPEAASVHLRNPKIMNSLQKLIAAGVLQVR